MRIALANFTRRAGMLLASAAFVLTAVFVFSSGAAAAVSVRTQQKKAAPSAPVAAKTAVPAQAKTVAAKPAQSAAKGMNTGIKVHGHWVINVLTPGGKLVSHTEFENSLQSGGMSLLARILGQQQVMGQWKISLAGTGPCTSLYPIVNSGTCLISQGGANVTFCNSLGCRSGMPGPVASGVTLQLTGALTFPSGGNVTQVETIAGSCPNGTTTLICIAGSPAASVFTSSPLPGTGVAVNAQQIVQVQVTFSFS